MRPAILILLIAGIAIAQPGIDLFNYYEGQGMVHDWLYDVYHGIDGGYYAVGTTTFSSGWIMRLSEGGGVQWSVFQPWRNCRAVIECDNGDIVVGGSAGGSFGAGRYSPEGDEIFVSRFGNGTCQAVIELKEGDFVLCGNVSDRAGLICIGQDGETNWETYLGNEQEIETLVTLRETDNGIVAAGRVGNQGWVVKVGFDGEVIWNRRHNPDNASQLAYDSMISYPRGGFALAGLLALNDGRYTGTLTIINQQGEVLERQIHTPDNTSGRFTSIGKTSDGGLVLAGYYIDRIDDRVTYPLAVRLNREHSVVWSNNFSEQVAAAASPTGQVNLFNSVIVQTEGVIVGCGAIASHNEGAGHDGFIARLEPEILGPQVFYYSPEDTILTLLLASSVDFIVRARNREGIELNYLWQIEDSTVSFDTLMTYDCIQLGESIVSCTLSDEDYSTMIRWHVSIRDLFISSHSPDTLTLAIRRGTTQTFSLDTVRAVEGDPVNYQWTLTNLDNFEREETGTEASATIEFLRSGNYQMEGLAYRGESNDNVIWTIAVRSAILDFWPRELNLSVLPDSLVNFGVLPFNPESDSLSYAWYLDGELIGQDSAVGWWFAPLDSQAGRSTYAVSAIVMDGAEGDTITWEVTVQDPNATPPTPPSIEGGEVPATFGILSVSPNPFNSTTTILYTTSGDAYPTRLTVHDLTGREVARLVDERAQQSPPSRGGPYAVTFDGRDLPAGIYFLRLEAENAVQVKKLALVR